MKRLLCIIFICITMVVVFTGCGGGKSDSEVKPDASPEVIATPRTTPEASPKAENKAVKESLDYVVTAMEDLFAEEMDYIVPEDEVDSDSALSNAVIRKTTVVVNAADKKYCDITVTYPDLEKDFLAIFKDLDENTADAEIETALYALAGKVENGEIPLTEKNFLLDVKNEYGFYDAVITPQVADALMGGLYILGEEVF